MYDAYTFIYFRSIVDHLFQSPHLIYGILHGRISKEIKELANNANEDVKLYFSRQVFDILVQIIKTSIALIRRRFVGSRGSKKGSSMFYSGKTQKIECFDLINLIILINNTLI